MENWQSIKIKLKFKGFIPKRNKVYEGMGCFFKGIYWWSELFILTLYINVNLVLIFYFQEGKIIKNRNMQTKSNFS